MPHFWSYVHNLTKNDQKTLFHAHTSTSHNRLPNPQNERADEYFVDAYFFETLDPTHEWFDNAAQSNRCSPVQTEHQQRLAAMHHYEAIDHDDNMDNYDNTLSCPFSNQAKKHVAVLDRAF